MTQTKTASAAAKSSAKGGLKPELNPTIGAPIHKDLYEVPADQEALKQEKIKHAKCTKNRKSLPGSSGRRSRKPSFRLVATPRCPLSMTFISTHVFGT